MRLSSGRPTGGAASPSASSSSVSCERSARNSIAPTPSARGPPCATSRVRPRRSYPARFGLDPDATWNTRAGEMRMAEEGRINKEFESTQYDQIYYSGGADKVYDLPYQQSGYFPLFQE